MEFILILLALGFLVYIVLAAVHQGTGTGTGTVNSEAPIGIAALHSKVICPYCQVAGNVCIKQTTVKGGISGSKATGALLTGGTSLLVTGLSKKTHAGQATCKNCGVTWSL